MDETPTAVAVMERDQPAVEATPRVEPVPEVETAETVLVRQVRYFVAICSFAAGILHLMAMAAHVDHHPTLGRAFLAIAAVQIVWGALLLIEPRRLLVALGAAATAGAIVVWVFSRTKGISWFPGLAEVEPIEWRDIVTQFFQLLAVAGSVVLLLPASVHKPAGKQVEVLPIALMSVLAMAGLAIVYVATHGYVHH